MSSRTASSRRAPAKRRKSSRSSGGQSMTTWLVMLGLVAGGIVLYDNRGAVLKDMAPLLSRDKPAASRTEAKAEPQRQRDKTQTSRTSTQTAKGPVPPAGVGVVKAAVPASRPTVAVEKDAALTGEDLPASSISVAPPVSTTAS